MKKKLILLLCACLLLSLCACGEKAELPSTESPIAETLPSEEPTQESTSESTEPTQTTEAETLSVDYQAAFSYRDESGIIRAIGIVQVTNHTDAALALPAATMEFLDSTGSILYTADSVAAFPNVIDAGESACYYEMIEPDLPDIGDLALTFVPAEPVEGELVRYHVDNITELADSPYGGLSIAGTVTNNTATDGEIVCVCAVIFGKEAPLAVLQTVLMEPLKAGQSADFGIEDFLLPADWSANDITSVQVCAFPL